MTKELSLYFPNCPDVAGDLETVTAILYSYFTLVNIRANISGVFPSQQFAIYWEIGQTMTIPTEWPDDFSPDYNASSPGVTVMNGSEARFYYSVSPPFFRPTGWTADEDAITSAIFAANDTVNIVMMDYVPAQLYATPTSYWNTIDDAIRTANFK